jgi:hypothetical protein
MVRKTGDLANGNPDQLQRFKELARELECNEDEAAFDSALKRIAATSSEPKIVPKAGPKKNSS